MHIVALETSSTTGSIATLDDERVLAETELGRVQRTAQSLAPALQAILRQTAWKPCDVELVALTSGPGSFTGLRAGVTTAKVFAYATGAEVVAVNTLDVIASEAASVSSRLWAVMDAQRQQLFVAQYAATGQSVPQTIRTTRIIDNDDWLKEVMAGDHVTGPGLAKLMSRLPPGVTVIPEQAWAPRASTLGRLAAAKYKAGERSDFWTLAPQYFRKSAAEEKFDEGLLK